MRGGSRCISQTYLETQQISAELTVELMWRMFRLLYKSLLVANSNRIVMKVRSIESINFSRTVIMQLRLPIRTIVNHCISTWHEKFSGPYLGMACTVFKILDYIVTSTAPDQIASWFMKLAASFFYKPLSRLFNLPVESRDIKLYRRSGSKLPFVPYRKLGRLRTCILSPYFSHFDSFHRIMERIIVTD